MSENNAAKLFDHLMWKAELEKDKDKRIATLEAQLKDKMKQYNHALTLSDGMQETITDLRAQLKEAKQEHINYVNNPDNQSSHWRTRYGLIERELNRIVAERDTLRAEVEMKEANLQMFSDTIDALRAKVQELEGIHKLYASATLRLQELEKAVIEIKEYTEKGIFLGSFFECMNYVNQIAKRALEEK